MERPPNRPLTAKQESFCQKLVAGASGTDAFKQAYQCAAAYANVEASKLRRVPHVAARIAELMQPRAGAIFLTIARKRELLREMAEDNKATKMDRQRAIDLDNRMTGVYISKVEVSGEVTISHVLASLSDQPPLLDSSEILQLNDSGVCAPPLAPELAKKGLETPANGLLGPMDEPETLPELTKPPKKSLATRKRRTYRE